MAEASRFQFYWERVEDTSVLTMRRQDWNTVIASLGAPVAFDVPSTPLSDITHTSSVVASVAHQHAPATARISVYRHDAYDTPYSINQDEYDVWTDLSAHPRLNDMITPHQHQIMKTSEPIAKKMFSLSKDNLVLITG